MSSSRPRVLLVDDEVDILDFLERVLRRTYEVSRCNNAREALEVLERSAFDVVISDQKMPDVSGIELLHWSRKHHPDMLRMLLSGYTELPDLEAAMAEGLLDHFVLKPIDSRRVLEAIAKVLAKKRG